jgi:hypothetical protein
MSKYYNNIKTFVTNNKGFRLSLTENQIVKKYVATKPDLEKLFGQPYKEFGSVPCWDVATDTGVCFTLGYRSDSEVILLSPTLDENYNKKLVEWVDAIMPPLFDKNNWLSKKRIRSTTSERLYELTTYAGNIVTCTCPGYTNRQTCKHILGNHRAA